VYLGIGVLFAIFVCVSYIADYSPGIQIARNSGHFLRSMIMLFPAAFILIGLFEVWIDRSVVERHLGSKSGLLGYFWVILLACTVLAPMIVALPIANSLSKKGARLQLMIGFISASTICRIPMTIFEASYLGIPFSVVRLLVSIPLVIIFSELIGKMFSTPTHRRNGGLVKLP
jgi:uncharacterized membrane protein YraQ (UPF0718 family)